MPARKDTHDNTNGPKRSLSQKLVKGARSAITSASQVERRILVDLQRGLNVITRPYEHRIMFAVAYAGPERLASITEAIEMGIEDKLPFYIIMQKGMVLFMFNPAWHHIVALALATATMLNIPEIVQFIQLLK